MFFNVLPFLFVCLEMLFVFREFSCKAVQCCFVYFVRGYDLVVCGLELRKLGFLDTKSILYKRDCQWCILESRIPTLGPENGGSLDSMIPVTLVSCCLNIYSLSCKITTENSDYRRLDDSL